MSFELDPEDAAGLDEALDNASFEDEDEPDHDEPEDDTPVDDDPADDPEVENKEPEQSAEPTEDEPVETPPPDMPNGWIPRQRLNRQIDKYRDLEQRYTQLEQKLQQQQSGGADSQLMQQLLDRLAPQQEQKPEVDHYQNFQTALLENGEWDGDAFNAHVQHMIQQRVEEALEPFKDLPNQFNEFTTEYQVQQWSRELEMAKAAVQQQHGIDVPDHEIYAMLHYGQGEISPSEAVDQWVEHRMGIQNNVQQQMNSQIQEQLKGLPDEERQATIEALAKVGIEIDGGSGGQQKPKAPVSKRPKRGKGSGANRTRGGGRKQKREINSIEDAAKAVDELWPD